MKLYLLIYVYSALSGVGNNMAPPTIKDVTDAKCPPRMPFKCLPDGSCFGLDSYCSQQHGTVVSCFPEEFRNNRTKILDWCRGEGREIFMVPECQFACQYRFNSSELNDAPENFSSGESQTWLIYLGAGLAALLIAFLLVIFLCWRKYSRRRSCNLLNKDQEACYGKFRHLEEGNAEDGEEDNVLTRRVQRNYDQVAADLAQTPVIEQTPGGAVTQQTPLMLMRNSTTSGCPQQLDEEVIVVNSIRL